MITAHQVPGVQFDGLARGDGGPPAVDTLLAGQLSKRVLQIRLLLDLAAQGAATADEMSAAERAFDVLATAQRMAPDSTERVLLYPPVGAWAAHCVARMRPQADPDPTVSDLSVLTATESGLGHLGAIAASSAVLAARTVVADSAAPASINCDVTVPLRDGRAVLPMLGHAAFTGTPEHGTATVTIRSTGTSIRTAGRTVELPADPTIDGPGWRALRRLETTTTGTNLSIWLDDIDPFREYSGLEVASELSNDTVARWNRYLGEAWALLTEHHQDLAETLASGLVSLVPLNQTIDGRGVSATAVNAFGAAAMTPPVDAATLAVGLIHEFQHSKLSALLDLIPLYDRDTHVLLYAPWRDDPRPLPGLLQGTYAYLGVTAFWRRQRHLVPSSESAYAHYQFARWREQAARAADVMTASGSLTDAGHRFIDSMRAVLAGWAQDPVPPHAQQASDEATLDHWLTWRLRNLRPDAEAVARLAADWIAGAPVPTGPPPLSVPVAGRFAPVPNDRLTLLHQRLRGEPPLPEASVADRQHTSGEEAEAEAGYRVAIDEHPDDVHAWAGLALTRRPRSERSSRMLCTRPEVVTAVYLALLDRCDLKVDPVQLADWLGALSRPPRSDRRCQVGGVSMSNSRR